MRSYIKWTQSEKTQLAQYVKDGLNAGGLKYSSSNICRLFREAIETLPASRRRTILGVSQVPWLTQMISTTKPKEEPSPTKLLKYLVRRMKRQGEIIEELEDMIGNMNEIMMSLQDLCVEVLSHAEKPKEEGVKHIKAEEPIDLPKVGIAGLRGSQLVHLKEALSTKVQIEPINIVTKPSHVLGERYRHIFALPTTPNHWVRDAAHTLGNTFSRANSTSAIISQITQLR